MSSHTPESGSNPFFNWCQSLHAQGEKNGVELHQLTIEFAAFKESVNARIERGDAVCASAVKSVETSLNFWGERLTKAEIATGATQDKLISSDEKLALRISDIETQRKVQMGRLETLMKIGGAIVAIVNIILAGLALR